MNKSGKLPYYKVLCHATGLIYIMARFAEKSGNMLQSGGVKVEGGTFHNNKTGRILAKAMLDRLNSIK